MNTKQASRMSIVAIELEINDLVALNLQVGSHHLGKVAKVSLLQLECILIDCLNSLPEESIHNSGCKNGFQVRFFVWFEFIRSI